MNKKNIKLQAKANQRINFKDLARYTENQDYINYFQEWDTMKSPSALKEINMSVIKEEKTRNLMIDFVFFCISRRKSPKSFRNKKLVPFHHFVTLFAKHQRNTFNNNLIILHSMQKNLTYSNFTRSIITQVLWYLVYYGDDSTLPYVTSNRFGELVFPRVNANDLSKSPDTWITSQFHLQESRICLSHQIHKLEFNQIQSYTNKVLIKEYIYDLLTTTFKSLSTIQNHINYLTIFSNLHKTPITQTNSQEIRHTICDLEATKYKEETRVCILCITRQFLNYLAAKGIIQNDYSLEFEGHTKYRQTYKRTAPPDSILRQIFNVLDKLEEPYRLMFLIMFCTGLRISEVCNMKRADCLERAENRYYIWTYQPKMKEKASNEIPENLFEMLEAYRGEHPESSFMFHQRRDINKPMNSNSFTEHLQKFFEQNNIKNEDGTIYHFSCHSFRHLMAVNMREHHIPIQYIQNQLHHQSPQMTMSYIELKDKERYESMEKFWDAKGKSYLIKSTSKATLCAQMLPNGVCSRPSQLGECPHMYSCLFCDEFRTSPKDLPIHKKYLESLKEREKHAKENGFQSEENTCHKAIKRLTQIIKTLEEITYA